MFVLAAPLVLLLLAGWAHRWIFDDGFIYLRVVRQIRVGNGPVFNSGQRVEAFTGPLWVAVLAVADLVTPLRLEWLSVLLGIGCSVGGAALAMAAAARLMHRDLDREFLVPVGIAVFSSLLPVWYFETSGLETGLAFLWLGACAWILARWADSGAQPLGVPGAIVVGLGWLVRPELALDSLVFIVVVAVMQWSVTSWWQRATFIAAAIAVPAAYELFRMAYFGTIVANTAIAKEGSRLRVGTGMGYLDDFVRPYWLWIPVVLLLGGCYLPLAVRLRRHGETRSLWVLGAFVLAAFLNAAAVIAFGGDYVHARLFLPALFALCAPVAVMPIALRYIAALAVLVWAVVCAVALRPPEARSPAGFATVNNTAYVLPRHVAGRVTLADDKWGAGSARRKHFENGSLFVVSSGIGATAIVQPTTRLADGLHTPTVVTGGIGALSYALGPRYDILDVNGLAEPLAAHLALVRRGEPGHEKILPPAWIAALVTASGTSPPAREFPISLSLANPSASTLPFDEQVMWARRALRCPALAGLERSSNGPITIRSLISNVVHSIARTNIRIPADPKAAYERFCRP